MVRHYRSLLFLAVLAAALAGGGYQYVLGRLDEEIRLRVEAKLREHYQGLSVSVRSARLLAGEGIEIRGLSLVAPEGDVLYAELAHIDEIVISCATQLDRLLLDDLQVTNVAVRRLKLRAVRQADGGWSVDRLFPLPKFGDATPTAVIENAAIELIDPAGAGGSLFALRDLTLRLSPAALRDDAPAATRAPGGRWLHVEGVASSSHFEQLVLAGWFDPAGGGWQVAGQIARLEVSPQLWPSATAFLDERLGWLTSLRGRADFTFQAAYDAPRQAVTAWSVAGQLSEARLDDPRIPYRITDIRADFHADPTGVRVEGFEARAGQTSFTAAMRREGYEAHSPVVIQATAHRLALEQRLVSLLPETCHDMWRRVAPEGLINAELELAFDGRTWRPRASVECLQVAFSFAEFPFRLEQGAGRLTLDGERLTVALTARTGQQPVRIEAEVFDPGSSWVGWCLFHTEGPIPIDQKLLAALERRPAAQQVVRSLQPRGHVSLSGRFDRRQSELPLDVRLVAGVHDGSLQYEKFPYPIVGVSGVAELRDGVWTFRDFTGRNDSGTIACSGRWRPTDTGGNWLELQFVARDVPLEEELRQALSPAMQRLWSDLRPRGAVDHLAIDLRFGAERADEPKRLTLQVDAHKWPRTAQRSTSAISVSPTWFPYQLDDVTGILHYRDGHLRLTNLRGAHGRARLAAELNVVTSPEGAWTCEVTQLAAERLRVDHDLISALPPALAQAATRLQVAGPLSVRGALQLHRGGVEQPLQSHWDLSFDLENGALAAGATALRNIHGGLRLVGGSDGERHHSRGELGVDSLLVGDVQLTDVAGPIWIDQGRFVLGAWAGPAGGAEPPRRVTAAMLGGQLAVDGQLLLDEEGRFRLQATLADGDLAQAAQQFSARAQRLQGRVGATVELAGSAAGSHSWRGQGSVRLGDADIYELPIMLAMLKLLSIKRPDSTAFTTSDIDFRIQGEHLYFDRIDFHGDAISLKGNGELGFDRQVKLHFYTLVGDRQLRGPLLEAVLGEASKQFLVIHVTGGLDAPQVTREAFPGLNESLQQIFPEAAPLSRPASAARPSSVLDRWKEATGWR